MHVEQTECQEAQAPVAGDDVELDGQAISAEELQQHVQQPNSSKVDSQHGTDDSTVSDKGLVTSGQQCVHWGTAVQTEWDSVGAELVDGLGLCSPSRWPPECRGYFMEGNATKLCASIKALAEKYVLATITDVRELAFRLATGKVESSPFPEKAMNGFRSEWAALLQMPNKALAVPEGQKFYLHLMAQTLDVIGDPDTDILVNAVDSYSSGVPVGYKERIPPSPLVFPGKLKQSKLDESDYVDVLRNYKSAEDNAEGLLDKFREDEAKGLMYPTTRGALKSEFPDTPVLVAALGAIVKADNTVRPLHDGTHFIHLNNEIKLEDQLQYPGPQDATAVIREIRGSGEALFSISGDIRAAHRQVKLRRSDWPLVCCRVDIPAGTEVLWVNKVGTFGVSSAPFWWSRLFGLVGRLVGHVMGQSWFYQLVYVDDLHICAAGGSSWICLF